MSQLSELLKKPVWKSKKARVTAGGLLGLLAATLTGEISTSQAILGAVTLLTGWTVAKGVEDGAKIRATAELEKAEKRENP